MARARRAQEGRHNVDIWPGFVDALSTLPLSVIFLLVVFVLAQFFLGQLLQGRTEAVTRLERQVGDLGAQLELEQDSASDLRRTLARINADLQQAFLDRDELSADLGESETERNRLAGQVVTLTRDQAQLQRTVEEMRLRAGPSAAQADELERELAAARASVRADREQVELQLAQLVQLRRDTEALQKVRTELEGRIAELSAGLAGGEAERARLLAELGSTRDRSKALESRLAGAEERTVLAQRELQARDLRLEDLERQSAELEARVGDERRSKDEALAQVQALTDQIRELGAQLAAIQAALDMKQNESGAEQATIRAQEETIRNLGQRLNTALAARVEELTGYRSEFFGELRRLLGNRDNVRVVGDRFVFQSEVIFASGSDLIQDNGLRSLATLAGALKEIAAEIPPQIPWVLQVDGHTDRIPIRNPRFPSNWELSAARAIAVAKYLIEQGVAADRVAARGFAEFQPLDGATSPEALERNRRIELKLTTR